MTPAEQYARNAYAHVTHLAETIGGRGSCSPQERQAAAYGVQQMRELGVARVRSEPFGGAPSTYRPYALAFVAALLGTCLAWLGGRTALILAALLSGLGTWGMLAESDFAGNWTRWLLPDGESQNVVGIVPAAERPARRVVLSAHLDTHRTPIFYSSAVWQRLFSLLVGLSFVNMAVSALLCLLGAAIGWSGVRWIGLAAAALELFALSMCLHADFTPFSPGANDNGSGVGSVLALAARLVPEPLRHTEVWLLLTGCEEAAAYGMAAFLDAHGDELRDAILVVLDQVGMGQVSTPLPEGLIIRRRPHPEILALARRVAEAYPELGFREHVGAAYTDAAVAHKRGFQALSLDAMPAAGATQAHWHQMSDTPEHVAMETLRDVHLFVWEMLLGIDEGSVSTDAERISG
ncbi:MAG: M28 family peptidase [Chloroflexi bacterium]|nr:M28 family peptidase [Chloroflexota bacterium]